MSGCPDKTEMLHAYFDGELDAANARAFESHLKTCGACAEALGELQALRDRLADPALAERAPERLRADIEAMVGAAGHAPRRRTPVLPRMVPWALTGGFAALAASLAMVAMVPSTGALESELVSSHVRSTLATHLVDVETSDRHTVKPWFNGKVDFAPPVTDLADQGFPLAGGRLDYLDRRVVAALVYRRNKHLINLFVWPQDQGLRRPPLSGPPQGYNLVHWTEGGLQFWAVSDVEKGDLEAFGRDFRARTGG